MAKNSDCHGDDSSSLSKIEEDLNKDYLSIQEIEADIYKVSEKINVFLDLLSLVNEWRGNMSSLIKDIKNSSNECGLFFGVLCFPGLFLFLIHWQNK
jgi:hypothetical protein